MSERHLATRKGPVNFPTFIPVTTFGDRYPLDKLIQPYLPRVAPAVMVSAFYAKQLTTESLRLPMMVDSGGFAALFENSRVVRDGRLGVIEKVNPEGEVERITPLDVLDLQEQVADIAFTLDFPIPPGNDEVEAHRRAELSIENAIWALHNRRRRDLPLIASIQGWDANSAREAARQLVQHEFDGFAIGGLVPRARDKDLVEEWVNAVRNELDGRPLHVFGLGKPETMAQLFELGVDSVDSSSYVKLAADGRWWGDPTLRLPNPSTTDRLHLALANLVAAAGATLPLSASALKFAPDSILRRLKQCTCSEYTKDRVGSDPQVSDPGAYPAYPLRVLRCTACG